MITRGGWLTAAGALVCAVAARLLGSLELFLVGVIALSAVVLAAAFVWTRRLQVTVERAIAPARVQAGAESRVNLTVVNRGRRATPVLRLRERVGTTRGADLLIGPLGPGESTQASYRLPTQRRGVIEIGPMQLSVSDPFGLAESKISGPPPTNLTVYPPTFALAVLPPTGGSDPQAGFDRQRNINRGGDEFHALRPYSIGDELRRVHWPSTARHDELMVRQDELPWQGRLTVVIDNGFSVPMEALDLATSVAASVLQSAHQRGNLIRLVTANGLDSGFTSGNGQLDSLLELLAVLTPRPDATVARALDRAATQVRNGGAVVITAETDPAKLADIQRLGRGFSSVTLVVIDASAWDPKRAEGSPPSARRVIRISGSAPFPEAWHRAMAVGLDAAGARR